MELKFAFDVWTVLIIVVKFIYGKLMLNINITYVCTGTYRV